MAQDLSFRIPLALPINIGDTTPDPGGTSAKGTQTWSSTTSSMLMWDGSQWTQPASVNMKQIEVTFPFKSYGQTVITVADSAVTVGQNIIASLSGDASSTGFIDDVEMDNVYVSARCTIAGYIDFICTPVPGPISGNRKINYILG